MDVDIDTQSHFSPLDHFDVLLASMVKDGKLIKHPAGAYFQNIPKDNISGLAAIPYKEAEKLGYFKIDFLHLNFLDNFKSKQEIQDLIILEPDWTILESQEQVEKLFQIHNHFDIVYQIKPKSVIALADTIALIRPGKRKLLNAYIKHPNDIRNMLYTKPDDGKYYFKKGHAVSYALTIVLQLHLIKGKLL
jgi:DNA polymerase III alpha subunit